MKLPKIVNVFKIKINYKSGISEVFECLEFSVKGKNLSWEFWNHNCRPIDIAFTSVDDIESIWQVGHRKTIIWK